VLRPTVPPRPPPGSADELVDENHRLGFDIGPRTIRNGGSDRFDLGYAVSAVSAAVC
jgi:hypothetical protein